VASVRARGLAWIDDPSNADRRFDRTRVRDGLHGVDGAPGVDGAWADTRTRGESALAWLMARAVAPCPLGSARLARAEFAAAEPALAVRAFGAVVTTLGGSAYPPRHHRLRTVLDHWLTDRGLGARTLGGCRLAAGSDGCLTVTREAGRIATRSALAPGAETLWDGRFRLQTAAGARGLTAARLNDGDWRQLRRDLPWIERTAPARAVRAGLPAVFDGDRFVGLPSLGAWIERPAAPGPGPVSAVFAPRRALSRAGFVGPVSLVCDAVSVV
jgi:tRNA(Ile)-lysidine synthase